MINVLIAFRPIFTSEVIERKVEAYIAWLPIPEEKCFGKGYLQKTLDCFFYIICLCVVEFHTVDIDGWCP